MIRLHNSSSMHNVRLLYHSNPCKLEESVTGNRVKSNLSYAIVSAQERTLPRVKERTTEQSVALDVRYLVPGTRK